jgi:hypothetical protein
MCKLVQGPLGHVQGPREEVQGPLMCVRAASFVKICGPCIHLRPLHLFLWPLHLIEAESSIIQACRTV